MYCLCHSCCSHCGACRAVALNTVYTKCSSRSYAPALRRVVEISVSHSGSFSSTGGSLIGGILPRVFLTSLFDGRCYGGINFLSSTVRLPALVLACFIVRLGAGGRRIPSVVDVRLRMVGCCCG